MKKSIKLVSILVLLITLPQIFKSNKVDAERIAVDTDSQVAVISSRKTALVDPENPSNIVMTDEGLSSEGELRIDFVSAINFASANIFQKKRVYNSLAQQFSDKTEARGSYVQITDLRGGNLGWSLQLKQESQFTNLEQEELTGASLSFKNIWLNTQGSSPSPKVFRDTITIDSIGNAYNIATAKKGEGQGVWLVVFGASEGNANNQPATLLQGKDQFNQSIIDEISQKPIISNSAVSLLVPELATINPGEYQSQLTWLLQATP